MVRATKNNVLHEYPLKIIEIDDFLLNSDDLIWKSVSKNTTSLMKLKENMEISKNQNIKPTNNNRNIYFDLNDSIKDDKSSNKDNDDDNEDESKFNEQDFCLDPTSSRVPRNLTDCSQITIVFIDSDIYRQHFEKSHLKLINNMIVMDRQISLVDIEDAKKFFNLVINSKRWLMHGTVKFDLNETTSSSTSKDLKRKNLTKFYSSHKNKNESITDILLILNTTENFIRDELISGFKKLITSFSAKSKAIFEINFEDAIRVYFKRKFKKTKSLNQKFEIIKSNVIFTTLNNQMSSLLNNTQSYSNIGLNAKLNRFGFIFNRIKNVFSNKVYKDSNNGLPLMLSKLSLDSLPYLLCYLDDTKTTLNYTSYDDEKFFNIINELKCNESVYDTLNTRNSNSKRVNKSDSERYDYLSFKHNASESEWSSSINSSFTTYSNSKSFDCLNENKYLSNYESSDIEIDVDKDKKFLNRSLADLTTNSDDSTKYNKNIYIKNLSGIKSKTSKILSGDSSISSSLSSISNYLNKKKKISGSFDVLNNPDSEKLIKNDIDMEVCTSDSTRRVSQTLSTVKFNEIDFSRDNKNESKKENDTSLSGEIMRNEIRDEAINRHPALVRSNLRSKSADLINEKSTKKTILKIKNDSYQETLLDYELIEQTTKMNTYLNSQIIHHKENSKFEPDSVKNQQKSCFKNHVSRKKPDNENIMVKSQSIISNNGSKSKIYLQNTKYNQNMASSQIINLDSNRLSRNLKPLSKTTNTYAKCCAKQNPKKSFSPPPPIFISPTGLIAPPPIRPIISSKQVSRVDWNIPSLNRSNDLNAANNVKFQNDLEYIRSSSHLKNEINKENKINFNEIRNKFENNSKLNQVQPIRPSAVVTKAYHTNNNINQNINQYCSRNNASHIAYQNFTLKNNVQNNYNHLNYKLNGSL